MHIYSAIRQKAVLDCLQMVLKCHWSLQMANSDVQISQKLLSFLALKSLLGAPKFLTVHCCCHCTSNASVDQIGSWYSTSLTWLASKTVRWRQQPGTRIQWVEEKPATRNTTFQASDDKNVEMAPYHFQTRHALDSWPHFLICQNWSITSKCF